MVISGRTSGFSIADKNTLRLAIPDGGIAFEYFASAPVARKTVVSKLPISTPLSTPVLSDSAPIPNNLTASFSNFYSLPFVPLLSLVFIGTGAGMVYFIRRRKTIPDSGNDFEIIDE